MNEELYATQTQEGLNPQKSALELELEKAKTYINKLEQQLNKANTNIDELTEENKRLKNELNSKEKNNTNVEKKKSDLEIKYEEANEELKNLQKKIKILKENKNKTEEEKNELKNLKKALPSIRKNRNEAKKKFDNAKLNASIRRDNKILNSNKKEAIIKLLDEEKIETENELKYLISLRRITKEYGIKDAKELKSHIEFTKKHFEETK